jgi:hypothetical protein
MVIHAMERPEEENMTDQERRMMIGDAKTDLRPVLVMDADQTKGTYIDYVDEETMRRSGLTCVPLETFAHEIMEKQKADSDALAARPSASDLEAPTIGDESNDFDAYDDNDDRKAQQEAFSDRLEAERELLLAKGRSLRMQYEHDRDMALLASNSIDRSLKRMEVSRLRHERMTHLARWTWSVLILPFTLLMMLFDTMSRILMLDVRRASARENALKARKAYDSLSIKAANAYATPRTPTRLTAFIASAESALSIHADLVDEDGSRIDDLVRKHLPRLQQRHADAIALGSPEAITAAETMLDQALSMARDSLSRARTIASKTHLDAMDTELRFLGMRSPTSVIALTPIDPAKKPAPSPSPKPTITDVAKTPRYETSASSYSTGHDHYSSYDSGGCDSGSSW